MVHLLNNQERAKSGIYNLGTGQARTFADLGRAVFHSLEIEPKFDWIEMPDNIRNQYQYFTEAQLDKLIQDAGYDKSFFSLEDGVRDYVCNYLNKDDPYL